MKIFSILILVTSVCAGAVHSATCSAQEAGQSTSKTTTKPIRALLIAGGCCHDYAQQQEALSQGIQARANIQVDVYWTDNSTTAPVLPLYRGLNWAADYDVIIHDECASDIKDPAIINRIVETHQKIPAVHLHCAMHSFRLGNDVWFKHLGLRSDGHGPQEPIAIEFSKINHPITETLSDWVTEREELYNNVQVFDAVPLAIGKQQVGAGDNARVDEAIVVWTNEKQGARSFSTSLGHNTVTVKDPRYLELVTRGILWACDKLTPEYLVPFAGENKTTFISQDSFPSTTSSEVAPDDATLVKVTASSTQNGNETHFVVDGKDGTRWCANGGGYPQWIQLEFDSPRKIEAVEIDWEKRNGTYQYLIEGSEDGKNFTTLVDRSKNKQAKVGLEPIDAPLSIRFLRVTGLGSNAGWCSLWELKAKAEGVKQLWAADPKSKEGKFVPFAADQYAKSGNIVPRIEKLSPEQEAEILKDVKVPEGFEVSLFAAPPAVNYPVFVASTVDGTVFVSSDGNGSLGRDPMRGRVIRLRDTDNDGRADETKVFCEIDSPRGLLWDKDRLYLMHPPHLSAFIDHDGDGVADEQKVLVKNLAFGYDKRPADHTTNGISLGVDGYLYIAGGDFGFINAEGTDGRTLTHRGGGVIRVRPDGTGLELFSTGTRNILEVAISPNMEMFARDNTNDGDGWDVRMHHFTGNDDHGYPRLYKNFADEAVAPLADYGGGSGCGAVYVDEPGFGNWNNAPFTADWGTGAIYKHDVQPRGATFQEASKPVPFIRMTRPTDADVDGNSRVYAASWKGANFDWAGPNVGYVVRVQPKNFKPAPMVDYAKASAETLVQELDSPSYRRRVEASRELMRRGDSRGDLLLDRAISSQSESRQLIGKLYNSQDINLVVAALDHSEPVVVHTAIRTLSQIKDIDSLLEIKPSDSGYNAYLRGLAMIHDERVVNRLIAELAAANDSAKDATKRKSLLGALARLHFIEGNWNGDSWGTRPDTRGPYYQPERWSQSDRILDTLHKTLESASASEAAFLVETMAKNRIESDKGLQRVLELAKSSNDAVPVAIAQLASQKEVPDDAIAVLVKSLKDEQFSARTKGLAIVALSNTELSDNVGLAVSSLAKLAQQSKDTSDFKQARQALLKSRLLGKNISTLEGLLNTGGNAPLNASERSVIYEAFLTLATQQSNSDAQSAILRSWENDATRLDWINASKVLNNAFLSEEIVAAMDAADEKLADSAKQVAKQLKIERRAPDTTPKTGTLESKEILDYVVNQPGNLNLGQRIYARAKCNQCHTTRQDELQKGPYLGNIAKTYKREELAVAVLDPSKSIAQGFITNIILTHDDEVFSGFVTSELNDQVTIRDAQGVEIIINKDDIAERKTSTTSSMPNGLLNEFSLYEFSSLLDYLESLSM